MDRIGYTMFDTALGRCAVAWSAAGLVATQLPESSAAAAVARLQRRYATLARLPPPPEVRAAIAAIQRLLAGQAESCAQLRLDWSQVSAFHRRVYEAARAIPPGTTVSYGELAARVGAPGGARAVGRAMGANPWPPIVPCHRVVAAAGRMGGFSAHGGVATKLRMLQIEGAPAQGSLALG